MDLTTAITRARGRFERVARHEHTPLADRVRRELDRLEKHGTVASERDLIERARELARMRAYVIGASEVEHEGRTRVAELHEWGVPASVIDRLEQMWIPDLSSDDDGTARVALYTIYEQYDYWEWYVEAYARSRRRITVIASALGVLAVAAAAVLLAADLPTLAIACAVLVLACAWVLVTPPPFITSLVMPEVTMADVVPIRRRLARGSSPDVEPARAPHT